MMMEWLLKKKKNAYLHHYDLNRLILDAINTGKPQALGIYHDLDELHQKMVTDDRENGLETVIALRDDAYQKAEDLNERQDAQYEAWYEAEQAAEKAAAAEAKVEARREKLERRERRDARRADNERREKREARRAENERTEAVARAARTLANMDDEQRERENTREKG